MGFYHGTFFPPSNLLFQNWTPLSLSLFRLFGKLGVIVSTFSLALSILLSKWPSIPLQKSKDFDTCSVHTLKVRWKGPIIDTSTNLKKEKKHTANRKRRWRSNYYSVWANEHWIIRRKDWGWYKHSMLQIFCNFCICASSGFV